MEREFAAIFEPSGLAPFLQILPAEAASEAAPPDSVKLEKVTENLTPLFLERLIASMQDGVVSIDDQLRIRFWNQGAARLTGKSGEEIMNHTWEPGLIGLCDETGVPISNEHCPVRAAIQHSVQSIRRLWIHPPAGSPVSIDLQIVPLVDSRGITLGASLLLRDASSETSLQRRVQKLYERATTDQLTQISNRAEFDRAHKNFIEVHVHQETACSLIICDLDQFKKVNDTFGHLAGDDVLRTFAQLLSRNCRGTDLVARYGGEEFVMLCADCSIEVAAARAESIRNQLERLQLPILHGQQLTASFGVAQHHANETAGTMLHRADTALLSAKESGRNRVGIGSESGRNRVVQMGLGQGPAKWFRQEDTR
jgi:diguanylate cyclase (GGDEF)-like protein